MTKKLGTKSYPAELREKAVRLVNERGYTLEQVAEQLGCSIESIRRWKEAAKQKLDTDTVRRIESDEDENKRLRKENTRLKMEVALKNNKV
jgi:transposase-like protein